MEDVRSAGSSIGVFVADLDAVIELYAEGFGLGPFERSTLDAPSATWRGTPSPLRLKVATAPLGPCEMELIEVMGGHPPHAEFLASHGEGMNHLNLDKRTVEAYLATLGSLYQRGIEPFWGYPFNSFCYVEDVAGEAGKGTGGVTFEIMVGSGHAGKQGHHHLGLVVADTERTIDFYTKLIGLGPFRTGIFPMQRAYYRNERIEATFKASFCDLGEGELRVYELVEGEGPLASSLLGSGEGLDHLALNVTDLERALSELAHVGVEPCWVAPEIGMARLDTTTIGGMTFALMQRSTPA